MSSVAYQWRIGAWVAAFLLVSPVAAQEGDESIPPPVTPAPAYPTTEFEPNATAATVTEGALSATVTMVPPADETVGTLPVLTVAIDGIKVAEATGSETDFETTTARASIAEIDPDNDTKEIYFASYSGGAHCCTTVIIVAKTADGTWAVAPVGDFDGDDNYLNDLDGDGVSEIATIDNRFLYQFDSYAASSLAPLVIYSVRNGEVVDVTEETRFLPAHRDWLAQLEGAIKPDDRWSSRGFLAGWLGEKIRLGEGASAWEELNAHWDFTADEGFDICPESFDPEDCEEDQRQVVKFPEALRLFLSQIGYSF